MHVYWHHTCLLRAEAIARRLGLPPPATVGIAEAMGIDVRARSIKRGGPVGFLPRQAVVSAVVHHLTQFGTAATATGIGEIFEDVDRHQQAANDYKIELLPGVVEFLEYHSRRGTAMSVFSSDRRENTLKILKSLGLDRYFAVFVGGGCVQRAKPDPEGFLLACQAVSVPPAASAYVTDTVLDLQMARDGQAGATVGVATGLDTLDDLQAHAAMVCRRLDELVPA